MSKHAPAPNKSPETLRAIEALLLWEGAASNERVRELFQVHFTTASRLLAQYAAMNPVGLSYSTLQRRWISEASFRALLTEGTLEEYLAYTFTPASPPVLARTHLNLGQIAPSTFALLHRACNEGLGISALHASMRHPIPVEKVFYPHAMVEAGRRWHVRAFVSAAGAFQDLALTRLQEVRLLDCARPPAAQASQDQAWTTQVDLRLVPHPDLSPAQKQVVRAEYFQRAAARVHTVRAALVPYVLHELRAATDAARQRPPEFQLYVQPTDELRPWLLPHEPFHATDAPSPPA